MATTITNIEFKNVDNIEKREIVVTLSNGSIIHIIACHESWQQYGGTTDDLYVSMEVAEKYNGWLHGED